MAWLDANEYLLLETLGKLRIDDIRRAAQEVRTRADGADEAPRRKAKPRRLSIECLMRRFILSPSPHPLP